jgi:thioredoxin 1
MQVKIVFYLTALAAMPFILLMASSCSAPVDITKIPLDNVIDNGRPTLVDFAGTDCIPCKLMKPMLEELEKEYRGRVNVVIIEYYHNMALAEKYKVTIIPTQLVFDARGQELTRHEGFWSKEEMALEIQKLASE